MDIPKYFVLVILFIMSGVSVVFSVGEWWIRPNSPDKNERIYNLWLSSIAFSVLGIFYYLLLKL